MFLHRLYLNSIAMLHSLVLGEDWSWGFGEKSSAEKSINLWNRRLSLAFGGFDMYISRRC